MKFNEKIIILRKNKGMTQDDLASAVGVSRQAVYKWESAQSYPEVTKLLELKLLFGVSIDDLLDDGYEVAVPEKKKRKRVKAQKEEATVAEEMPTVTEEAPVEVSYTVDEATEVVEEESSPIAEEKEEKVTVEDAITVPVSQNSTPEQKPESASTEKKVGFFGRIFGRK